MNKILELYGLPTKKALSRFILISINIQTVYIFWDLRSTLATPLQHLYGFNNREIGVVFAVQGLGAFFAVFFGWIGSLFKYKKFMLTITLIVSSVSMIISICATTFNYIAVSVLYILAMIFSEAVLTPTTFKTVSSFVDKKHQGHIFSLFGVIKGILGWLYALSVVELYRRFGANNSAMQKVMIISCAFTMFVSIIIFISLPKDNDENKAIGKGISQTKDALRNLKSAIKHKNVWLVCGVVFCSYAAYSLQSSFYLKYLNDVYLIPTTIVGFIMSSLLILRPISNLTAAPIMKAFKLRSATQFIKIILFIQTILLSIVIIIPKNSLSFHTTLTLIFISFAMAIGFLLHEISLSILGELKELEAKEKTQAMSLMLTVGYLPMSIMPLIVGMILQSFTHNDKTGAPIAGATGYIIMFIILIICHIGGIFFCSILEKREMNNKF